VISGLDGFRTPIIFGLVNIVQLTPGAGGMYCGNCFRDNILVKELRRQGHDTLMIPLYLEMTLEEEDATEDAPLFYNGINVYLDQISKFFRKAPRFIREITGARQFLKWTHGRAAKTRAEDVGELTLSMLMGESGNQTQELDDLIRFLKAQGHPDVISLSNSMLIGMARRLKQELGCPVVCQLQGEFNYVESMRPEQKEAVWKLMAERARDIDLFISPSQYFADLMKEKLEIPNRKFRVIHNGINLDGYEPSPTIPRPTALGFFARMCPEKGLDLLVEAFLQIKARNQVDALELWVGGGCGPGDEAFVAQLQDKIKQKGWISDAKFFPNLSREDKQDFLRNLNLLCVPAEEGEAFGLYTIEALASGVPLAQPNHSAFPEIIEATQGGVLCDVSSADTLSRDLEKALLDLKGLREMGTRGREVVLKDYSAESMAKATIRVYEELHSGSRPEPSTAPATAA